MVKPKKLNEIWEAEVHYEELRWSEKQPLEKLDLNTLKELRADISETIRALTGWLGRRLLTHNCERIEKLKRKLIDFRWNIVREIQRQQQREQHLERIAELLQPRPRNTDLPAPAYGMRGPLKGSDFYKEIPRVFNPRPKMGVPA